MVEKKRIVLLAIDNRTKSMPEEKIKKYIKQGSTIYTDCWKGYNSLENNEFLHRTVNHSKEFVNKDDNTHTNTIEGNWCAIKLQVPLRGRNRDLISLFLVRYMILRNENGNPLLNILKYLL